MGQACCREAENAHPQQSPAKIKGLIKGAGNSPTKKPLSTYSPRFRKKIGLRSMTMTETTSRKAEPLQSSTFSLSKKQSNQEVPKEEESESSSGDASSLERAAENKQKLAVQARLASRTQSHQVPLSETQAILNMSPPPKETMVPSSTLEESPVLNFRAEEVQRRTIMPMRTQNFQLQVHNSIEDFKSEKFSQTSSSDTDDDEEEVDGSSLNPFSVFGSQTGPTNAANQMGDLPALALLEPPKPKTLHRTSRQESIGQYGGKITDYGLIYGEESLQLRLELWLGNAIVTLDGEKKKFSNKRLKDLAKEPLKIKHKPRGWIIKVGADADAKHVQVWINGQSYEELQEWESNGLYKSSLVNNWKGNVKRTEYVVVDGETEVPIKIRHDEKNSVTKIQIEEREEVIRGKSLNDDSLFPLTLSHESRDWSLEFDIDRQVKRFNLKLNNRAFADLPDEAFNLPPTREDESNVLSGTIQFNDGELLKGQKMGFAKEAMAKLFKRKCRGNPATSVAMNRIDCGQNTLTELIEFTSESIAAEGLQQLRFSEFFAKVEVDVTLLEQLAEKCVNLQLLTIRDMNRTSEQVREALVHMSVQVLRIPAVPLTSLWLSRLGSSEEGDQLLQAICASDISTLRYLNLGDNKSWWASGSAVSLFSQFLARQVQLEELNLHKNDLGAQMVTDILEAVRTSECMVTLKKLQLDDCTWDQQGPCEQLVTLIADAPCLQVVRIMNQKGGRRIQVDYTQARAVGRSSEPLRDSMRMRDRGSVRIFDPASNTNIYQLNTWRTEDLQLLQ